MTRTTVPVRLKPGALPAPHRLRAYPNHGSCLTRTTIPVFDLGHHPHHDSRAACTLGHDPHYGSSAAYTWGMTRTTVRPLGALVGSGVGSRGSLVGSVARPRWRVHWFVGSLVVSLAWLVGSGVLACGFACGLAGVAGGLAGVFARWLACSLCRRLLWSAAAGRRIPGA